MTSVLTIMVRFFSPCSVCIKEWFEYNKRMHKLHLGICTLRFIWCKINSKIHYYRVNYVTFLYDSLSRREEKTFVHTKKGFVGATCRRSYNCTVLYNGYTEVVQTAGFRQ